MHYAIFFKKIEKYSVKLQAGSNHITRELNKRLQPDHDGPEDIEQVLKKCSDIGIMGSFDLRLFFWQVPLAEESRKYCGFVHAGKTYQYIVVPFGLAVSSGALSRASHGILNDVWRFIMDFVDDWLIFSKTIWNHIQPLAVLF